MWFVLAQTALKSAFVLGANEDGLSMANENSRYTKVHDVLVKIWYGR